MHIRFFFCLTTYTTCNMIIIEYVLMIRRCRNSFLVYLEIAMDNSRRRQTGGCTRAPHNSCPHGSSPPETSNNSPSIRNSLKIIHRYHQLSSSFIIRAVYLFFSTKKTKKTTKFHCPRPSYINFFYEFNNLIDVKYLKAVAKVKKGLILHCLLAWVQWSFIMDSRLSPFTRHHHRGVTGRRRRRGQTFRHC